MIHSRRINELEKLLKLEFLLDDYREGLQTEYMEYLIHGCPGIDYYQTIKKDIPTFEHLVDDAAAIASNAVDEVNPVLSCKYSLVLWHLYIGCLTDIPTSASWYIVKQPI